MMHPSAAKLQTRWFEARIPGCYGLRLMGAAWELNDQWRRVESPEDGTISAVFADWLEEHFEEVVSWDNRPQDVRLVIEELQSRALTNNECHEHQGNPPQFVDPLD